MSYDDKKHDKLQEKQFLTVEEAAKYLDLSKSALYKRMSNREIPYYKPGGKKAFFRREDLDVWVFSKKVESREEIENKIEKALERRGQENNFHQLANKPTII